MNKLLILGLVSLLTACEAKYETKNFSVLPDDLKDCRFYEIANGQGTRVTVGRCPNSTTTVQESNKSRTTTVLIDGKEYIKK